MPFYNLSVYIFVFLIRLASFFNRKAGLWIKGRKKLLHKIKAAVGPSEKIAWFHCASLGEFEQGRPVIEAFKNEFSDYKILLTFFSPSGYEIRKNYLQADYIFYMPADTKKNAREFISIVKPKIAFFIKYEFWFNHLIELQKNNIPVILISGIFRENQLFFRFYGKPFLSVLRKFRHLFVQNQVSEDILRKHEINQITRISDTRFDRVIKIASESKSFGEIEKFSGSQKLIVAGSTWPADEEILIRYIHNNTSLRLLIAPHEIHESHIRMIERALKVKSVRFSRFNGNSTGDEKVLIIDNIGMLSALYKYGHIAYIGGGFGKGIHNTLEAAVYGIPVFFGPNYGKFNEAKELINEGGAFSVNDYKTFEVKINELLQHTGKHSGSGKAAYDYVHEKGGSTGQIIDFLKKVV